MASIYQVSQTFKNGKMKKDEMLNELGEILKDLKLVHGKIELVDLESVAVKLDSIDSETGRVEDDLTDANEECGNASTAIESIEGDIDQMKRRVTSVTNDISELKIALDKVEEELGEQYMMVEKCMTRVQTIIEIFEKDEPVLDEVAFSKAAIIDFITAGIYGLGIDIEVSEKTPLPVVQEIPTSEEAYNENNAPFSPTEEEMHMLETFKSRWKEMYPSIALTIISDAEIMEFINNESGNIIPAIIALRNAGRKFE